MECVKLRLLSGLVVVAGVFVIGGVSPAGPVQLLSARDPSIPLATAANGASVSPWISPDGRFVVFSSSASDLVTNDNGYLGLDVFLRDRASNTVLVSRNLSGTGGGNGQSYSGMASADGRYVVFESVASDLVAGDTNGLSDIFVRDLWTGTMTLVSVSTNGLPFAGASTDPNITPDGRYVGFFNGVPTYSLYVRDLVVQTTTYAGTSQSPSSAVITPDARYVAFSSNLRLIPDVPTNAFGEVYVRDLIAGQTIWASTNVEAFITNALSSTGRVASLQPSISDDGRFVTFKAWGATNYSNPMVTLLFRFDSLLGKTDLISTNGLVLSTYDQTDDVYGPEISPNGRFITYAATFGNTNTIVVQQWDANTGSNILVSIDVNGNAPTNSISHSAKASPDNRFVTFLSNATNLVTNVVSSGFHVYLRDVLNGVTQLVDANTNGVSAIDNWGAVPVLSSNGQFVAFSSPDGTLVNGDDNNTFDVFVRENVAGTTELISQRSPLAVPKTGNSLSSDGPISISADGRRVTFTSYASDLVTNDFNNEMDVFVSDRQTGSNILVSVGMDGNSGLGGNSITPVISADGRYVVFASLATNLVATDTNGAADIFRRDLQTGTTTLVSVNTNGANLGAAGSSTPVSSEDGRYVAFLSSTNLSTNPAVYWRDLLSGTTVNVLVPFSPLFLAPSISADGQRVALLNIQRYLFVWDAQLVANISSNWGSTTIAAAISPDGTRVANQNSLGQLLIWDVAASTNKFVAANTTLMGSSAQWSGDGRYFAFVTPSNLITSDSNFTNDVYLCDAQNGTVTLVSSNWSGTAAGNGSSDSPVISGDGRFVVFRSWATDIVSGAINVPALYAFDRVNGTTSLLTAPTPGSGWNSWVLQPVISSNATTVAFVSWDSGLAWKDFNRAGDIFAAATSVAPPPTDSDGDGIPDWWMVQYFGHPTGQAGDKSLAQDDADNDGSSNLQEYLGGTVPTDQNSVLRITISAMGLSMTNKLTWTVSPGKTYHVEYKNDLTDSAWLESPGPIAITGNEASFITPTDVARRFYRVVVY